MFAPILRLSSKDSLGASEEYPSPKRMVSEFQEAVLVMHTETRVLQRDLVCQNREHGQVQRE